jgi:hypothetical protein
MRYKHIAIAVAVACKQIGRQWLAQQDGIGGA